MPTYWNWAVFGPESLRIVQLAILLLAFLLIILQQPAESLYSELADLIRNAYNSLSALPSVARFILWTAVPFAAFYLLKTEVHIYGDAQNLIGSIIDGKISSPLYNRIGLVMQLIAKITGVEGGSRETAADFIAIISVICGAVFVFFAWKSILLLLDNKNSAIAYLALISSGFIILFAGFIETYPIIIAWLAIYIYYSLKTTQGKGNLPILALLYLIGIFWHLWFIAFLPSLLWIINQRLRLIGNQLLIILSALFLLAVYLGGQFIARGDFTLTIPFLPNENTAYWLFSPSHLLDFFNQLIIVGPTLAIAGLALIIAGNRDDSNSRLLLWAAIPALFVSFIIDPHMGAARDFDLLSMFAFPLILYAVYKITRGNGNKTAYLLIPVFLFNLLHVAGVTYINKHEDKAIERIVAISLDDAHYQNSYHGGSRNRQFSVILSNIYGRDSLAAEFAKRLAESDDSGPLDIMNLANYYYNQENFEKAAHYYGEVYRNYQLPPLNRFNYGRSLLLTRQPAKAVPILKQTLQDTAFIDLYYFLGTSFMLTGQPDSCLKYFEIGLAKFPDKAVTLKKYAEFFAAMGMNNLAGSYMARIIPLNPGSTELRREVARLFNKAGMPDSAQYYMNLGSN